jgi:hypothetical protein
MPPRGNQIRLSITDVSKTIRALLTPQGLLGPALLLSSGFIGRWHTTPGIQPQGVTLAVDDRHEED